MICVSSNDYRSKFWASIILGFGFFFFGAAAFLCSLLCTACIDGVRNAINVPQGGGQEVPQADHDDVEIPTVTATPIEAVEPSAPPLSKS